MTKTLVDEAPTGWIEVWSCDLCRESGEIRLETDEDVWGAGQKILDAHRQRSLDCPGGRGDIRCSSALSKVHDDESSG